MFKRIFGYIFFKIYAIGKLEYERRNKTIVRNVYDRLATIDQTAKLGETVYIQNSQNDRTKIVIGKETLVSGDLIIFKHGGEINIGNNTFIGKGSRIWSSKKITIGNRVLISHDVNIHDNNSHPLNAEERHKDFKYIFSTGELQPEMNLVEKEITIEDDVWIGFNATILKGVTIGKGAIIGSNAIITKDVPPFAVIVSSDKSEIIKYVN